MTSRERVQAAINFQPPDRMPCSESLWPDTLDLWREQGLPAETSVDDYFGFDISYMSLDCSPRYEQEILAHDGEWYTYRDRWGYTATKKRGKSSSVRFFDHRTTDREAWEASKHRWSPAQALAEPERYDRFFVYDFHVKLNDRADERARIAELARSKTVVSAIDQPGDWKLSLAHRVLSQLKLWRQ